MKTIYKYILPSMHSILNIPKPATILSAGEHNSQIVIWAIVDTTADLTHRYFHAINTGQELNIDYKNCVFVGTVTINNNIVWHVFVENRE